MVDVIIGNHRARIEGEKLRNVASTSKGLKSWQKPDSYYPCSTAKTVEPKELFLVEGNSAGGGLKSARNAKFQAILTFRGKSLNVWDLTLDRALQSIPWLNLVKVLGCGIGPTFDIKKLYFDKIIIATDADIDGYHIRVGMCSFFVKFLPGIIEAGKLYIAEPPLYKLAKDKDIFYVASQTEYLKACVDSIGTMELEFPEMK
jgi:DNA gyrase subunit B